MRRRSALTCVIVVCLVGSTAAAAPRLVGASITAGRPGRPPARSIGSTIASS